MNIMKTLLAIELTILIFGSLAIGFANYEISKDEIKMNKERQEGLKIHTIYRDCFCESRE